MLGLFRKSRRKQPSIPVNRVRLSLESLESRDCPSAPTISLNIAYGAERMVTLSGQVTDDQSTSGLSVTFSGAVQATTFTNADGTFSMQTQASSLGNIEATAVDIGGLPSNTATVTVATNAPQITDTSCSEGVNGWWTFTGRVIDESAANLVIRFAGLTSVANQTVTVEADGTFCFIVQLQPGEEGTVTAVTTDWWGIQSNTASYIVRQT